MIVASFELCKQLYALSGWKEEYIGVPFNEHMPGYSLSYLLHHLPKKVVLENAMPDWECSYWPGGKDYLKGFKTEAHTPDDAVVKLAIELFQQGILQREGDET